MREDEPAASSDAGDEEGGSAANDDQVGGEPPLLDSDDAPDADAAKDDASPKALLAIDIGGTKFAVGVMSSRGEMLDRAIGRVQRDVGPEVHMEMLAGLIGDQVEKARQRHRVDLVAAGIGCAGPIERDCVTVSPLNIGVWQEFPLRDRVVELTGLPTYGDLDSKALVLAEGWLGAARGLSNYCVMTVSTGVGGGLVLDGRLVDGASGNAGHVGHVIVEPNGRRCACGARGCLEAEASGTAIEAITGRPPTSPSYEIMVRTGQMVGRAAATMCNLFDIDLVIAGGGVANGFGSTFFNAATIELSQRVTLPYSRQARIVPSHLGDRAPLVGAAAIAIRGLRRMPPTAQRPPAGGDGGSPAGVPGPTAQPA